MSAWKQQSHANALISKTLSAFTVDPGKSSMSKEEKGKAHLMTKAESKQAQELAMEIAMGIDVDGKKEKPKKQSG